ncbi:MAG: tRNA (adenosine(37)-N6)-threonylcarbamoyltransferase complex transferase subunit TsaD, partial [Bdellovibrionales bacterium]
SGGHSQLVLAQGVGRYRCLGTTLDDAIGECFDKSAKLMGLGYPGGPRIELAARDGRVGAIDLPAPMVGRPGCDFSFSGLKTAVRLAVQAQEPPLSAVLVADMAACLQTTISRILTDRTRHAFTFLEQEGIVPSALVVGGGVAANQVVRAALTQLADAQGVPFYAPPMALCTDNGAMIAWAGLERFRLGMVDDLTIRTRPRWPLESLAKETGGVAS